MFHGAELSWGYDVYGTDLRGSVPPDAYAPSPFPFSIHL